MLSPLRPLKKSRSCLPVQTTRSPRAGYQLPVALEGALKLKEISYIHAEGYPAAEMKHGPIALIDEDMPVIFIATQDEVYEKVVSNIQEVKARGGKPGHRHRRRHPSQVPGGPHHRGTEGT